MRSMILAFITLWAYTTQAEVPYPGLNDLRLQSVVVRMALDNPTQSWVKKCVTKDKLMKTGQTLAALMENAASDWQKIEIVKADIAGLNDRISFCETRGSCQVYDAFLNAVQANKELTEDVLSMKAVLEKKLATLTSKDFQTPFKEIKQPCILLKKLTK